MIENQGFDPNSPKAIAFRENQARHEASLRAAGDRMELWRHCGESLCKRRRACRRSDANCFRTGMRAMFNDRDRAVFLRALQLARQGVPIEQAIEQAEAAAAEREREFPMPQRAETAPPVSEGPRIR